MQTPTNHTKNRKRSRTSSGKPIDPGNDRSMIKNGLRPNHLTIDRSVFVKSDEEKEKLKRYKQKTKL